MAKTVPTTPTDVPGPPPEDSRPLPRRSGNVQISIIQQESQVYLAKITREARESTKEKHAVLVGVHDTQDMNHAAIEALTSLIKRQYMARLTNFRRSGQDDRPAMQKLRGLFNSAMKTISGDNLHSNMLDLELTTAKMTAITRAARDINETLAKSTFRDTPVTYMDTDNLITSTEDMERAMRLVINNIAFGAQPSGSGSSSSMSSSRIKVNKKVIEEIEDS